MERQRKDPERADPITRLIASRVKVIRDEQRLSGAALSSLVRDLGLSGWVDSTVGKLETLRRESVTVTELFALAIALRVPPIWLLVDPRDGAPIPIAEGVEADSWSALLWLTGRQPLTASTATAWDTEATVLLSNLYGAWEALVELDPYLHQLPARLSTEKQQQAVDEMTRGALDRLGWCLQRMADAGATLPRLPADVRKRAAELGVKLPGQEIEESAP